MKTDDISHVLKRRLGVRHKLFVGLLTGAILFGTSGIYFWNQPCETTFWHEDGKRVVNPITNWSQCEAGTKMLGAFTNAPRDLTDNQSSRLAWIKFATIGSIIVSIICMGCAVSTYLSARKDNGE